jgi:hypothetical protein
MILGGDEEVIHNLMMASNGKGEIIHRLCA